MQLDGKIVIVAGGAGGIGGAISEVRRIHTDAEP